MRPTYITDDFLKKFIAAAIAEDVGDGDHSSMAAIPAQAESTANLLVKDTGILAGVELARFIFHTVDKSVNIKTFLSDGDSINYGDVAFEVSGSARTILTLERLVLNCMQRMSAIATATHRFVSLIAGTGPLYLTPEKQHRISAYWKNGLF